MMSLEEIHRIGSGEQVGASSKLTQTNHVARQLVKRMKTEEYMQLCGPWKEERSLPAGLPS